MRLSKDCCMNAVFGTAGFRSSAMFDSQLAIAVHLVTLLPTYFSGIGGVQLLALTMLTWQWPTDTNWIVFKIQLPIMDFKRGEQSFVTGLITCSYHIIRGWLGLLSAYGDMNLPRLILLRDGRCGCLMFPARHDRI